MSQLITGIHHVTAFASDSQMNVDFYTGILGLRLVKKTVNFDAPDVYHLYYGNELGSPGTILTFFPYPGVSPGRHGKGMLNTTTFSVQANAIDYWLDRLSKYKVKFKPPQERLETEAVVYLEDPDGLGLELVFNDKDKRPAFTYGHIPVENSIKGFYSVEIWEDGYERTAGLLTEQMDHVLLSEKSNRFRFAATDSPGNYIDIVCMPESMRGLGGAGTVHHIAFATSDGASQVKVREKILARMLNPTPVIDRTYFTSIYYREPGGVLFEVATAGPGFAIDETIEHLGEGLKLPPQYEPMRTNLEKELPPIKLNLSDYK